MSQWHWKWRTDLRWMTRYICVYTWCAWVWWWLLISKEGEVFDMMLGRLLNAGLLSQARSLAALFEHDSADLTIVLVSCVGTIQVLYICTNTYELFMVDWFVVHMLSTGCYSYSSWNDISPWQLRCYGWMCACTTHCWSLYKFLLLCCSLLCCGCCCWWHCWRM